MSPAQAATQDVMTTTTTTVTTSTRAPAPVVDAPKSDAAQHDAVLTRLLALRDRHGNVSNAAVRAAAEHLGVSTRTVRRRISTGAPARRRSSWAPDENFLAHFAMFNGNAVAALASARSDGQSIPVHKRTVQRALSERYDAAYVTAVRAGSLAGLTPHLDRHIPHRNHTWAIDHTQLPIWIVLDNGELTRPWLTTLIDERHRLVLAARVYAHDPNTEQSIEAIAIATEGFMTSTGVFVGGKPERLLSDRGSDLVNAATTIGLTDHGILREFTEGYTPQQNGGIERWHKTLKHEVLPKYPGYWKYDRLTPGDQRAANKAAKDGRAPVETKGKLTLDELTLLLHADLTAYNEDRPHSALDGLTPVQSWAADTTPLATVDPEALRASMTMRKHVKIRRGRITVNGRSYVHHVSANTNRVSTLSVHEGREVEVRSLPTRIEYVSVYLDGQWLCDAVWTKAVTEDHIAETKTRRDQLARDLRLGEEHAAALRHKYALDVLSKARAAADQALAADGLGGTETPAEPASVATPPKKPKRATRKSPGAQATIIAARDQAKTATTTWPSR